MHRIIFDRMFKLIPSELRLLRRKLLKSAGRLDMLQIPKRTIPCGVLVTIFKKSRQFTLLLVRRSPNLDHHGGQIAFPGGRYESADRSLRKTAIREAYEEIGVRVPIEQILGSLRPVSTRTGFWILPFVCYLSYQPRIRLNSRELVGSVEVPLKQIFERSRWAREDLVFGQNIFRTDFFFYGDQLIWGATARILKNIRNLAYSAFSIAQLR